MPQLKRRSIPSITKGLTKMTTDLEAYSKEHSTSVLSKAKKIDALNKEILVSEREAVRALAIRDNIKKLLYV